MHRKEWSRGTPPEDSGEGRHLGELGAGGRDRRKDRDHLEIGSGDRGLPIEPNVVVVIPIRFEIVVMPVSRRSQQVRELGPVLEGVGT